eukprot:CAMPEP_0182541894 /NCGR_PEP_ID=MMETSP1323-20130603/29319_1 /TAXON_ID=236787 /ORGANISM="Florenciella parvula, Strain RCC1693" /LENGTH=85 /DNA_ID=CAMNT_0024752701 /DNA_START=16 /DNA_END=273 /DNA_ORIENTATION=+
MEEPLSPQSPHTPHTSLTLDQCRLERDRLETSLQHSQQRCDELRRQLNAMRGQEYSEEKSDGRPRRCSSGESFQNEWAVADSCVH